MLVVVLFVPAALPWYYTWPLAVVAPLAQSRRAVAAIAGVLDLDHGDLQTRWRAWHVLVAARAAGHRVRADRVVLAVPAPAQDATEPTRRDRERSVRHRLRAAHDLASLMGVQRVDRAGVADRVARCRRGVTVSDGSGVNNQRTISVSW